MNRKEKAISFEYIELSVDNGRNECDMHQLLGSSESGFANDTFIQTQMSASYSLTDDNRTGG